MTDWHSCIIDFALKGPAGTFHTGSTSTSHCSDRHMDSQLATKVGTLQFAFGRGDAVWNCLPNKGCDSSSLQDTKFLQGIVRWRKGSVPAGNKGPTRVILRKYDLLRSFLHPQALTISRAMHCRERNSHTRSIRGLQDAVPSQGLSGSNCQSFRLP